MDSSNHTNITVSLSHLRLTGRNKEYYKNQMVIFSRHFDDKKYTMIEFGKQDARGVNSITFIHVERYVPMQRHFDSKEEMLGYIVGYNTAKRNEKRDKDDLY